jgi:hypothetical protein
MPKERLRTTARKVGRINNGNGKIHHISGGSVTGLTIRDEYLKFIRESPYSTSKLVDIALASYFQDRFKIALSNILNQMYIDLMMLEKLQEKKKMGLVEYSAIHGLQIEAYKDAIRILENSPLFDKEAQNID